MKKMEKRDKNHCFDPAQVLSFFPSLPPTFSTLMYFFLYFPILLRLRQRSRRRHHQHDVKEQCPPLLSPMSVALTDWRRPDIWLPPSLLGRQPRPLRLRELGPLGPSGGERRRGGGWGAEEVGAEGHIRDKQPDANKQTKCSNRATTTTKKKARPQ